MYELTISEEGHRALAYIDPMDLACGIDKIYFGDISSFGAEGESFSVDNAEAIVTHESTHIAIYKMTMSLGVVRMFDNVDSPYDERGVYICSRPFE